MPRNVYFSQAVRSEQNLYEDLIIESLKIYGQDVYYVPRTLINRDTILGEDAASKFDDAYLIEAYIENVEGFEGAGDLYSKFGLEIRDEITFVLSRRQWEKIVGVFSSNTVDPRPQEGDVIFLPMTNSFFEITFVEDDKPFYQLADIPVYRLTCALFEYSDEDFDTGIGEIDDKTAQSAYQIHLTVDMDITGQRFEIGETVKQIITPADGSTSEISVFGEVQSRSLFSGTNNTTEYYISNIGVNGSTIARDFYPSTTQNIIGQTNNFTGQITSITNALTDTTNKAWSTDGAAQNIEFETLADGFIDFSESNPFGDPSETY